jgi:hypothetical protein
MMLYHYSTYGRHYELKKSIYDATAKSEISIDRPKAARSSSKLNEEMLSLPR